MFSEREKISFFFDWVAAENHLICRRRKGGKDGTRIAAAEINFHPRRRCAGLFNGGGGGWASFFRIHDKIGEAGFRQRYKIDGMQLFFGNAHQSSNWRRSLCYKGSIRLYPVPSRVRTLSSLLSCNLCRLWDDFDNDGQLDSIAPKAQSARSNPTARRRRNHLEVCKSCMTKVTRVSTLSMGYGTEYRRLIV